MAGRRIWHRSAAVASTLIPHRWQLIQGLSTGLEGFVEFDALENGKEGIQLRKKWMVTTDPQMRKHYQMLYKSTCWRDVERSLNEAPIGSEHVVMAWNTLKMVPDGYLTPLDVLNTLAAMTTEVTEDLTEVGFASVWHSMGKMNALYPELMQKLTERAIGESGTSLFLVGFSPRHLTNVLHSVARLHRFAMARDLLSPNGEVFPLEPALVEVLVQQLFRRLNELNELDLSNLAAAMGILGVSPRRNVYQRLAEEAEKQIHLSRFVNQDLVDIAFGLTAGGKLDLFRECHWLVEEILSVRRLPEYNPRQLALLVRCLCVTDNGPEKASRMLPVFRKLICDDALPTLQSSAFRPVVIGLGFFRIEDPELWRKLTEHLLSERGISGVSMFDMSTILYSTGLVRYYNGALLDRIVSVLMKDPSTIPRLSRLGLSNCFFGVGSLKYRNEGFMRALCSAVLPEEMAYSLTTAQLANIIFSLGQLGFRHERAVHAIISASLRCLPEFSLTALVHLVFGLSLGIHPGKPSDVVGLFEEAFTVHRLEQYSNACLSMAMCALGRMRPNIGHRWPFILQEIQKSYRLESYSSIDLIRIVKTVRELAQPVPTDLRKKFLEQKQTGWITALPNRPLLDYLRCLEYVGDAESLSHIRPPLMEAVTSERVQQFREEELSDLVILAAALFSECVDDMVTVMEELLEKIILHGSLRQLSAKALYLALSALGHAKHFQNQPVLYSLELECSKRARLESYNEQQLTGVFYNLAVLKTMHQPTFDAFTQELTTPQRLMRYQEHHVVKILKGLSIGKRKNGLIAQSVLNAFLRPNMNVEPITLSTILFNIFRLNCWKSPYIEQLMDQISKETDLSGFSMWDIGIVMYVLGRMQHQNDKVVDLICEEMKKERLKDANDVDLCNLIYGFAHLGIDRPSAIVPLLSETLKGARCDHYSNSQLVQLLQSVAEWQIVDPCQLAGLVEPLTKDRRCTSMTTAQWLTVLKSLAKMRIFGDDVVRNILLQITQPNAKLRTMTVHDLYELRYFSSLAQASGASESIQAVIVRKEAEERDISPEATSETSVRSP